MKMYLVKMSWFIFKMDIVIFLVKMIIRFKNIFEIDFLSNHDYLFLYDNLCGNVCYGVLSDDLFKQV